MVAMAALLTPDEVDQALARLKIDGDRIAEALVALETHSGHQFLTGARTTGRTATLWERTQADIALLYQWFGAYRTVMDNAATVRARRTRPGATELTELTALLRGDRINDRVDVVEIGLGGLVVRNAPFVANGEHVELVIEAGDLSYRFSARGVWMREDGEDYRVGLALVGMPVCLHTIAVRRHNGDVVDRIDVDVAA